jgi:hypothetical protein
MESQVWSECVVVIVDVDVVVRDVVMVGYTSLTSG